jgi:hypothetical protein
MPQYLDSSCSCPRDNHVPFDATCRKELALPISAGLILNSSEFCTSFQLDMIQVLDPNLELGDLIGGLSKKVGLYHLWIEEDYCHDHLMYSMRGLYVGKGEALGRVKAHALEKLPPSSLVGVTFFECENRVAKYLEQLFLDIYAFPYNINENPGTLELYASWDEGRRIIGTEAHAVANKMTEPGDDLS